jgi:hypothetical protein
LASARSRLISLVAASLVLLGCGASGSTASRSSGSSGNDGPTVDTRCAGLQQRGISPCPPPRLPLEQVVVRNGTGGAVADDAVRAQGLAYVRAHTLYSWAVRQAGGDGFLMSGALAPPEVARTNVFRTEVKAFAEARTAGETVRIDPLRTTEITLVPVPAGLQDVARRDGLRPSQYGWVDNQAGPARVTVQTAAGATRDVLRIPAGQPHPILVFGEVREDADLGSIWYVGGEFGCLASAQVKAACDL